jgi:hypothetical protein
MVRIAISQAAFDAIAATIRLKPTTNLAWRVRCRTGLRRFASRKSYSDVILRLARDTPTTA